MSIRSLEGTRNAQTSVSHLLWHGDPVPVDECEHFVVVHHRVHALDPQSVHRSVKHDPLLVRALVLGGEQQSSFHDGQSDGTTIKMISAEESLVFMEMLDMTLFQS